MLKILSPPGQRFACRDCPSRCCRLPWRIRLRPEEAQRYLADPWVRDRAGPEGVHVLARGVLPMREEGGRPACVFLDDDGLCSLQKREGHAYLPRSCQAFPFAFARDERDTVVAQLSQVCPSIRDDYGDPIAPQLPAKLQQKGDVARMADTLSTLGGLHLTRPQYLRVARRWEDLLAGPGPLASRIAHVYDWTLAFEAALPNAAAAADAAVTAALARADQEEADPLPPRAASFHARALFATLLGSLCYPARLRLPHRIGRTRPSFPEALRTFAVKIAWLLGWGTVDMLFVPRPFRLQRVRGVARLLGDDAAAPAAAYLRLVLQRRQIFCAGPRRLMDLILDLALSVLVIAHVARCRAAAEGREKAALEDVREGLSAGEMLLSGHASIAEQGGLVKSLRRLLATNRARFREVLATEA